MVPHKSSGTFAPSEQAVDKTSPGRGQLLHFKLDAVSDLLGTSDLKAMMADGYRAMSELNLALAREDEATLAEWPDFDVTTSEADPSGDS